MRTLNEEEYAKVQRHLSNALGGCKSMQCFVCGGLRWDVVGVAEHDVTSNAGAMYVDLHSVQQRTIFPTLYLCCQGCGHLVPFAWKKVIG